MVKKILELGFFGDAIINFIVFEKRISTDIILNSFLLHVDFRLSSSIEIQTPAEVLVIEF